MITIIERTIWKGKTESRSSHWVTRILKSSQAYVARSSVLQGFPDSLAGKESSCNAKDVGLIPGLGRYPGEGKSYPLQYSGLENRMDYSPRGYKESNMTELSPHWEDNTHLLKWIETSSNIKWITQYNYNSKSSWMLLNTDSSSPSVCGQHQRKRS